MSKRAIIELDDNFEPGYCHDCLFCFMDYNGEDGPDFHCVFGWRYDECDLVIEEGVYND